MPKDLVALGLIKNETDSIVEVSQTEDSVSYVADEEHYTEVFKRMTEVKRSLKIATANLKNFSVFIDSAGREETLRLCDFFMSLVERGVHVQVVCMYAIAFFKKRANIDEARKRRDKNLSRISFGFKMKAARERANMTLEELADYTGIRCR